MKGRVLVAMSGGRGQLRGAALLVEQGYDGHRRDR